MIHHHCEVAPEIAKVLGNNGYSQGSWAQRRVGGSDRADRLT
jgi:hypothetical protein